MLRENIILTAVGILFGAVFGIGLHRYIIVTVEVDAVMFGRNIRPVSFVYCALLTCVFSAIVNLFMHKNSKDKYGRISEICRIGQILESEVKNGREYL